MNLKKNNYFYSLTASSVSKYLELNGWIRDKSFKNLKMMVFENKKYKKRIAIPSSENFEDFYVKLKNMLNIISTIENKQIDEIIKEIATVDFDRMEFRIISEASNDGKLPLEYASKCIEGLKDLVLYAACAEQNAQPICFKTNALAKKQLAKFKLAQTEFGSFVINIDIRVANDEYEQLALETCDMARPFEHKIVERISNAIFQVDSIVSKRSSFSQITDNGYQLGITANMCDALLKLKPDLYETEIETTIRYAPSLKDSIKNQHFIVKRDHFLAIDEIGKRYRDKIIYEDAVLTGIIKSLSKNDVGDHTERIIRLITQYNGKYRTISMELSDEYYIIACDAHRDGIEVEASGTLDMNSKNWQLINVTSFHIK